jgi:hypothetical protein
VRKTFTVSAPVGKSLPGPGAFFRVTARKGAAAGEDAGASKIATTTARRTEREPGASQLVEFFRNAVAPFFFQQPIEVPDAVIDHERRRAQYFVVDLREGKIFRAGKSCETFNRARRRNFRRR